MDELVNLFAIEELEEVEHAVGDRQVADYNIRNPLRELNNEEFRKTFRVTKELFEYIVEVLEPYLVPKIRPVDLDIPLKVMTALRFYATGSYQLDIGSNFFFFGLSQSSVSRCIEEVTDALNMPEVLNRFGKFPSNFQELNAVRLKFFREHNIPGVIGCIDCTHVAIFPPRIEDPQYPEHLYVNRKGYHSINVQLVCDSDLKILNVNSRYPGSTHDSFIWNNSNVHRLLRDLHDNGHKDYFLLGDSGYPLRTWLLTPIEGEPEPNTPEYRYNVAHKRTRSLIERCNGVLKMRFRCCLKHRVLLYTPQKACKIINACVVLHNLCIEHNIPEPEEEWENEEIDFGMFVGHGNEEGDIMNRVNPELMEGRLMRRRIILAHFRN